MVNRSKCVSEVNICNIDVFIGEYRVFEGCYDHLDLSRGISLWTKTFLAKV